MRKISANYICPVVSDPIKEGVVVVHSSGEVLEIGARSDYNLEEVEVLDGIIVPGFVNTHCHLELSHMKGKVDTGTGLLPFIESVVKTRGASKEEIQQAIKDGDQEMYENGIVAVGDISNQIDTFETKQNSALAYYTFVECFDFLQEKEAQKTFDQYKAVYDQLKVQAFCKKSLVPHAPYSVSKKLFQLINEQNCKAEESINGGNTTISIHNQETPPENELFINKKGGFIDFYSAFDIDLSDFKAQNRTAIHYALEHLLTQNNNLFVHNTLTTKEDIKAAKQFSPNTFWATCPNANLYIENRLPNYQNFIEEDVMVTIGTDSLTSNWQLNILEEIKTISRYQSYVDFHTLLKWATFNGAKALGFQEQFGSIEIGKSPGLVHVTGIKDWKLKQNAKSTRLI